LPGVPVLRELLPRLSHIAVLWNPANLFHVGSSKQARDAAQAMRIKLQFFAARSTEELAAAFVACSRRRSAPRPIPALAADAPATRARRRRR
jgi:hypothetical protein